MSCLNKLDAATKGITQFSNPQALSSVLAALRTLKPWAFGLLNVTGFWITNRIVTLGLFHFIGTANGHTHTLHIHSAITRLGGLVCFSRASLADPVNS